VLVICILCKYFILCNRHLYLWLVVYLRVKGPENVVNNGGVESPRNVGDIPFVAYFFFLLFYYFYIYLHVYTLLGPPTPPTSMQNLFHPLLFWFCWRENIGDNKKNIAFLLVWGKHGYTERFVALLPCTCVLKPTLVHLCNTSSLLPGPLPIVASASFRMLYSLLCIKHINHIQVLGFLPFPYSSHAHSILSVWPMFNKITAFVLGL
jgi:hypothetical protein